MYCSNREGIAGDTSCPRLAGDTGNISHCRVVWPGQAAATLLGLGTLKLGAGSYLLGTRPTRICLRPTGLNAVAKAKDGPQTSMLMVKIVRVPGNALIKGTFWADDFRLGKR